MAARLSAVCALACAALAVGGGAAATTTTPATVAGPPVVAHALGFLVTDANGTVLGGTTQLEAPPAASIGPAGFGYPADGSFVSAASATSTVDADANAGTASGLVKITDLSIFGGEITASSLTASASATGASGDLSGSDFTNLIVLGQSVSAPSPGLHMNLDDWGTLDVLSESATTGNSFVQTWQGAVSALSIHLDADHLGLSRGSTIRVGIVDASSHELETGPAPAGTGTSPTTTETAATATAKKPKSAVHTRRKHVKAAGVAGAVQAGAGARTKKVGGLPVRTSIPNVTPKLTAGRYVFPVYGPSAYGDTFGAPRGDVPGGWHHGDDIFAPLGAPILAVADGTVFSVGWNEIGGWRLWLRDKGGNEFYYAHLSAYTTLAVNGRHVKAGQVLGFVGNTGDAQGTPFHLHFEVHPVSLLFLGYDGAVNPTRYLDAWKRLEDVRILPAVPFTTLGPEASSSSAPAPGAILLRSSDISTANGLDPGSLARAMNAPPIDVTAPSITELPTPLPVLDRA